MLDFTYENHTRIHFGKDSLNKLEGELARFGKNILLVYGKGAIKRIGLYDKVIEILKKAGKNIFELEGVMPNPTYEKVLEGAEIVKKNKISLILAVGGGSVIDCAKGISVVAKSRSKNAFRKYWVRQEPLNHKVVPVGSILTMVGTGSEANAGSVITHNGLKVKLGRVFPPFVNPIFSILNPEYTYSVSEYQMVSGIFDIISHLLEQYFGGYEDNTSDYIIEGLLKAVIANTPKAIANPSDYVVRANLMWASTMALNKISSATKLGQQDWQVHGIEHQLGAYTDCAHGMGLAAISTAYYPYIYKHNIPKFKRFAINVWGVDDAIGDDDTVALEGLKRMNQFIKDSHMCCTLKELGATKDMLKDIAKTSRNGGGYGKVSSKDILKILQNCFE